MKLVNLKDALIRKLATSFLLRWADGKKTEIMRVVQAINMLLLALISFCEPLKQLSGYEICEIANQLNASYVQFGVFLGHVGLELGIQDAKAKDRKIGIE